jgi:hypothetical protein
MSSVFFLCSICFVLVLQSLFKSRCDIILRSRLSLMLPSWDSWVWPYLHVKSISWVAKSPPALLTVLLSLVLHLWFALFCFNNWALCSTMTFNWQFSYDWSSLGNCFWGLGGKIVDWLEDRGYVSYLFIWSIQKGLIKFHREIENHNLPGFYELGIK